MTTIEQQSFENSKNWLEINKISKIVVYHDPDYDTIWLVYDNVIWGAEYLGVNPSNDTINKEVKYMLRDSF